MSGNLEFEEAKKRCLSNPDCIGVDRQSVRASGTCGNIIKLCKKFALRGLCDCTNPSCSQTECMRYKQDKVTCIIPKGKEY